MAIEINKVAVLGSGIMGVGISGLLASAGLEVELMDIVPQFTEEDAKKGHKEDSHAFRNKLATEAIKRAMKMKQSPFMAPEDAERVRPGHFESNMERIKECDWIIEVVVEDLKIKKNVFKEVKKNCNKSDESRDAEILPRHALFQSCSLHAPRGGHTGQGDKKGHRTCNVRISRKSPWKRRGLRQGYRELRRQSHRRGGHHLSHAQNAGNGPHD